MIKGTYTFYEDGKEIYKSSNIITKFGKRFFTNVIAGNILNNNKELVIGVDSTAATINDTRLGFEFYRTLVDFASTDIQTVDGTSTYSVVYKTTLPQGVSGTISEVGIYPAYRTSTNDFDSKFITDFNNYLDWTDLTYQKPEITTVGNKIGDNLLKMSSDSTSVNEYKASTFLNISGYSIYDSIRLAYYKYDSHLQSIQIRLYSSDLDYYYANIVPASGTGYKISNDILLSTVFSNIVGNPNKENINQVSIRITPTSGFATDVGLDGLRINDEDTFDPIYGLISRSVLNSELIKYAGRQIDIEYRLDLTF
jgi:hypothetical protein